MKVLKYIFNIVIWTSLGLYLLFILTFKIPAIQQYYGELLAGILGDKIGTSVTIGRVDIGIPTSVRLFDVAIRDQKGHDMVVARRLSARVDLLPLLMGKISISSAQLLSAQVLLYQRDSLSKPNFQFVLDSLASKDTTNTAPLDLRINSLIIRNSYFSYNRYDKPETPQLLNPEHLCFSNINAHIILKALSMDSVNANIKRLSFKEKSGLQINRLSMKYTGSKSHSQLQDFILRLPNSRLQIDHVTASYLLRNGKLVFPSLYYNGSISKSAISPSDLACLLPSLKNFKDSLFIESVVSGQGEKLTLQNLAVTSQNNDVNINIDGWLNGLDQKEPTWQANINDLKLSANTVKFISENLKGQPSELPDFITRMGNIHLRGIAKGEGIGQVDVNSRLNTDIGDLHIDMRKDKQYAFQGRLSTNGFLLGPLLADERLGVLSTHIDVEGRLPVNGDAVVNAKGAVDKFEFNGYTYSNIHVNGSYSPQFIIGLLTVEDPNLSLNVEGSIEHNTQTNIVNLKAAVDHLSPKATHLSDQWGDAVFSTTVNANFSGNNLNDAVGTLDINDLQMTSTEGNYLMKALHVESGYDNDTHFVTLTSDFAKIGIQGHFDYETLPQSFTNFLASALPTLPGLPEVNPNSNNNFSIQANITKSDWMQRLLHIPVELKEPLTLEGVVNDRTRNITLECDIPHFYYKDGGYKKGNINISAPDDSLHYDLRLDVLSDSGTPMQLHVFGKAADNNLHTSLNWDNHESLTRMSGQLNAVANFTTSFDNKQTANVRIEPSVINIHNADWYIDPAFITYSKKNLDIRDFTIRHGQQHLIVNGTASESTADSIIIDLNDIDVEYILQFVGFDAVDFSGLATGRGNLRGIFGDLQADARLAVHQFEFQHGRMGTLHAAVDWNKDDQQIDIHAIADDGPEAKTYINGYVSPERNYIDLGIRADGTYLDFAKSFTKSFISKIDGHSSGEVRLIGPLDAINLTGQLVLNGTAHVKTLGCTYEMRNDTLRMVPNEIEFTHCPIYDIHGNEGMLTGGIHHQELTNLTYDIYVDTQKMMVYDFPDFGEEMFYGTVYVQGRAGIHGRNNEVVIEADVTPLQNSFFVYNAAAPDVITNQEFIQWGNRSEDGKAGSTPHASQGLENSNDYQSDLIMRIKVNATPDATMRLLMDSHTGDYINLKGSGDIQATYYNKGSFNMFGTYEVSSGTYDVTIQNVIRKNFTFKEGGTIVFNGDPYDALLNMQAQYLVSGVSLSDLNVGSSFSKTVRVNCLMNITGQPRAPIIDFDLDIPNVNTEEKQIVRSIINGQEEMRQQVVYLLAVGRFYPQGANNASENDSQRSSTSLAMQSLLSGTLSGQINSVLSQVIKSNNWNFGANISTGDEGWNNAEYEGLISGRLLNNRLLINGQFGYRDNARTASPSFIGDFDIRYLLLPNGNLALKVYNQTNDRYFTRSSLNTQGIGIIMKKDFNGWRDLFRIKKKGKKQSNSTAGNSPQ